MFSIHIQDNAFQINNLTFLQTHTSLILMCHGTCAVLKSFSSPQYVSQL